MGKIIEAEDQRNNRLSHNKRNGLCEMAVDKQYDGNTKNKNKNKNQDNEKCAKNYFGINILADDVLVSSQRTF